MHYKRQKPKEKKLIRYGTPKYVQMERKKLLHSAPGQTTYPCKKRKGDHDFIFLARKQFLWSVWETYRCAACGKKMFNTIRS